MQRALAAVPGVRSATVLLSAEKAIVEQDPTRATLPALRAAVEAAGYRVPDTAKAATTPMPSGADVSRQALTLLGIVVGAVLFVAVIGEWLGLFARLTDQVPFWVCAVLVLLAGWPIFHNVLRATLRGQVIAHTLMSVGAFAALAIGAWTTAAVVVFFMRIGAYAETLHGRASAARAEEPFGTRRPRPRASNGTASRSSCRSAPSSRATW